MKKKITTLFLVTLIGFTSLVTPGCYGEYALVRKVYTWNRDLMGDDFMARFVENLVFIGLNVIPIYPIAGFIDAVILNLIEFWTGSNPLAMGPNDREEQLVAFNGRSFKLVATQNKFSISEFVDGKEVPAGNLVFNDQELSWNVEKGSESIELFQIIPQKDGNDLLRYRDADGNLALARRNELRSAYESNLAMN